MKYIGIGKCTKYNIYLLIAFISEFFIGALTGLNSSNSQKPARIFPFRAKMSSHNFIYDFVRFSSILIGGVVLYFFDRKNHLKNKEEVTIEEYETLKEEFLIKNKGESITFNLILIGVLYSSFLIFQDFISLTSTTYDFWTIEILIIGIISYLIFKKEIYIHKKLAIGIMLVVTIVDIIGLFFPSSKHEKTKNMNELTDKNIFERTIIKYGAYAIPIFILVGIIRYILRDYCWIKMKYLMDIRSIPPYKIFISSGIIGIVFVIILASSLTFIPCKTFNNIDKKENDFINNNGEQLKLYLEYCTLKDYDENTKTLYLFYDSMKLISTEYSNTDKNNLLKIFLYIPLYFIFYLINEVSRLMLIRYTDPNSILIYRYFNYFIKRIIQIIINKGDEQYTTISKFIILEFEELAGIISSLIYIETLELKFCGFDYELKKNINKRGIKDTTEGFDLKRNDTDVDMIELSKMENVEDNNQDNIPDEK